MIENNTLKVLGISAKIATGFIIVGIIFTGYKNYIEIRRTRLQIELLKKQLEAKKLLNQEEID
jgi:hypothetical protein